MIAFIDEHKPDYGVEPICQVMQIAPSTWYDHRTKCHDPSKRSARVIWGEVLKSEIERVFKASQRLYGARKLWHQLRREGRDVGRCTVERLMCDMGLAGVIRGKTPKTTRSGPEPCPQDLVDRQFHASAPNQLWGVLKVV